jgi:hypothetical protein
VTTTAATTAAATAASLLATTGVPIAAAITPGGTVSRRIGVGSRHGMLGMFCIDSGIIL